VDFATTCLLVVLAPLAAAVVAGLGGRFVGRAGAHTLCIAGVAVSFAGSAWLLMQLLDGAPVFNQAVYVWGVSDGLGWRSAS
jgi:NADH-quinone oxidoreductase subunit L